MVNSYVNEMVRHGMFILSHFCIHKYTGAIAAVHVTRNIYIFIPIITRTFYLIRTWKIYLEIERVST